MQAPVPALERLNPTGGGDRDGVQEIRGHICDDGRRAAASAAYEEHAMVLFTDTRFGGCHDALEDDTHEALGSEHAPLRVGPRSAAIGSIDSEVVCQVDDPASPEVAVVLVHVPQHRMADMRLHAEADDADPSFCGANAYEGRHRHGTVTIADGS